MALPRATQEVQNDTRVGYPNKLSLALSQVRISAAAGQISCGLNLIAINGIKNAKDLIPVLIVLAGLYQMYMTHSKNHNAKSAECLQRTYPDNPHYLFPNKRALHQNLRNNALLAMIFVIALSELLIEVINRALGQSNNQVIERISTFITAISAMAMLLNGKDNFGAQEVQRNQPVR